MAHGFSGPPTLGQFIEIARRHGVNLRHTADVASGPKGAVRFYYLQREPGTPFVVLPDLRQHRQLYWDTVRDWCQTLSLPVEDFGLPSED